MTRLLVCDIDNTLTSSLPRLTLSDYQPIQRDLGLVGFGEALSIARELELIYVTSRNWPHVLPNLGLEQGRGLPVPRYVYADGGGSAYGCTKQLLSSSTSLSDWNIEEGWIKKILATGYDKQKLIQLAQRYINQIPDGRLFFYLPDMQPPTRCAVRLDLTGLPSNHQRGYLSVLEILKQEVLALNLSKAVYDVVEFGKHDESGKITMDIVSPIATKGGALQYHIDCLAQSNVNISCLIIAGDDLNDCSLVRTYRTMSGDIKPKAICVGGSLSEDFAIYCEQVLGKDYVYRALQPLSAGVLEGFNYFTQQ